MKTEQEIADEAYDAEVFLALYHRRLAAQRGSATVSLLATATPMSRPSKSASSVGMSPQQPRDPPLSWKLAAPPDADRGASARDADRAAGETPAHNKDASRGELAGGPRMRRDGVAS